MQDQVFLASLSGVRDSLKIQFPGKVGVPLVQVLYLCPGFAAYFLSGDQGAVCPSLLTFGSNFLDCLFWEFCN